MSLIPRRNFLEQGWRLPSVVAGAYSLGLGVSAEVQALSRYFPPPNLGGKQSEPVRFSADIEPWVRLIEETPRETVVQEVAKSVRENRLGYRQLLAALFLAGIRNIQPRPSVGFKFHAVLVVNSAHLASLDSPDNQRWLPIFWALDNFKSSQARDLLEGNWTMPMVDAERLPDVADTLPRFQHALETWDEEEADVATAALVRNYSAGQIFDWYAKYIARDFRSIGHKVIYLANAYRTLQAIGWQHAEPVLRSLSYAMLNHTGEPNPSNSDLVPDRDGRRNHERLQTWCPPGFAGKVDDAVTQELLEVFRDQDSDAASQAVFEALQSGIAATSIYDAMFCFSAELTMRQPAIVPLHALTTTNAMHYVFRNANDLHARAFVLLQNAAFLPRFRDEARRRGSLAERCIDDWRSEPQETPGSDTTPAEILEKLGTQPMAAAVDLYAHLSKGNSVYPFMQQAREMIFLKGNDSHDYKYSSAVLEDYFQVSQKWRPYYLAAALFKMRHAQEPTTSLIRRIQAAVG